MARSPPRPVPARLSLRYHIALYFALLLAAVCIALGITADRGSRNLVQEAVQAAFDGSAAMVVRDLEHLENRARAAAEALAANPVVAAAERPGRDAFLPTLVTVLRVAPEISAAYLGWPDGEFVLLRRLNAELGHLDPPAGARWLAQWAGEAGQRFDFFGAGLDLLETREDVDYPLDPRERPWFRRAADGDGTIVTAPYIFFTTREPGITAARRAASGAVAGVDVSLWDLSARLTAQHPAPSTQAVVIDLAGGVLADANATRLGQLVSAMPDNGPETVLPPVTGLDAPVLDALADYWIDHRAAQRGRLLSGEREWLTAIEPLGAVGTAFVMAAPMDELAAGAHAIRNRLLTIFGIALLLGVAVVLFSARFVAWPVERFTRDVEAVAQLDFRPRPRTRTRVSELARMDEAIAAMRSALGGFSAVARSAVEEDDLHQVIGSTLDAVAGAADADRGSAWLIDGTSGSWERVAWRGTGHPDAGTDCRELIEARCADGQPSVTSIAAHDPRAPALGGGAPMNLLVVPLRIGDGRLIGAICVARCASAPDPFPPAVLALAEAIARPVALSVERRLLIADQRATLERLRLLDAAVARLNDLVMITEGSPVTGPDGPRIVYVNEAFTQRTGYEREEALGRTPRMLQGPDTQRAELDRIREALEASQPVRAELINYTRSGEPLWLELDIVPIFDGEGRCSHWVAVERDITERKAAEAQARLQDERFQLLAQAASDVIWDWDLEAGTLWWNDNLRTLFGYDPEQLEPGIESWISHLHPGDRDRVVGNIHDVLEGSAAVWREEYRLVRADGRHANVIDRGFVIRDGTGRAIRMIGSIVDVTERRMLDEQLRQSQKLETIGQLTGGVAHDFNNLLTVIIGNVESQIQHLAPGTAERKLADMTLNAAERAAELTARLLAFGRRQTLDPVAVDPRTLVPGMHGLLRRTLPASIEIRFRTDEDTWPALVDPGQLEVALLNLAVNARDAMPDGGRLQLESGNVRIDEGHPLDGDALMPGDYVRISVSDTGTGMDPEVCERAFDPFYTTKPVGRGTGLGLSMVYGFAKQSGGHAAIESRPGAGTTVRLYLPRADDGAKRRVARVEEPPERGGTEHILLVEDEALLREHAAFHLRALGYRVTTAGNASEALAALREHADVALLFTDIVMPGGMDGVDLAAEARDRRPGLPVLYTSGYAEGTLASHGRAQADAALISKPYRRRQLAETVRSVLDGEGPGAH